MKESIESLINPIKEMVITLKHYGPNYRKTYTSFVADPDFDVEVTVKLLPKKTQEQIGREMFGVLK